MTTNQRASARPHSRASASETLAEAHTHMTPAEIAAHALRMADELEALARILTSQNGIVTAVADTLRNQSMTVRSINDLYRAGRKREAREALATAAAVPDLEPMPLAIIVPEWSMALFSPAEAREGCR
ncbi:hypothetical protein NKI61_23215 [Mesorhizobium sp. M0514]|uniref:hypothetical protein n=1 Tax=Mesorhizobium sp. M0514 TaxID=2956955 RepID=UPI003337B2AC